MDNKYYIPTIKEFHVGFEYDLQDELDKTIWYDWKFNRDDMNNGSYTEDWIEDERIRVKYLDKQDIEELGWIRHKGVTPVYDLNEYKLLHYPHDLPIMQNIVSIHNGSEQLYKGIIKNKSELNKLMKQLNII